MPAPPNQTAGTAIDLGALPASTTQDVHDAGTTYDVWYKVTAPIGSVGIGLFGFGALANPYKPRTRVYSDAGITQILDTGTSKQNRPVQFGVVAGNTYWLRFTPNAGNPTPAILEIEAEEAPNQSLPVGSICVNDDTELFPLVIVSAVDGDDYNVLTFVGGLSFPAGEAGDVLPTGECLVSDSWNTRTKLFDDSFVQIADLALDTDFGFGVIRACHGLNKFYVAVDPGGATPIEVYMVDALGNIDATSYTLTGKTNVKAIAANNAGTILYFWQFQGAPDISIQTWDLALDIAGPTIVADDPNYDSSDLLYLDDDTLLALYFPTNFIDDVLVKRFDTSGTLLNTYNIGPIGYPAFTFPRLAQAIDNPNSFWIMFHMPAINPDHTVFRNIKVSDGSTLAEVEQIHYETGVYQAAETATPTSRFGVSFSCPFWLTHTGAAVTGTLIIEKVTDPSPDTNVFTVDVGGGLIPASFTIQDGGTETYLNVPAASGYSVIEQADPDYITTYEVSNDPTNDNTNITVGAGETVTVTITNMRKGSITVGKLTDPLDPTTSFPFVTVNLSPGSFNLLSEEEQFFGGLTPGSGYSVVETPVPAGKTATYLVSNGSLNTNISVAAGENVTVIVLNSSSGGGLRKINPGVFNDVDLVMPPSFAITGQLIDK